MLGRQLAAEVEALLAIGPAGGELAAEREPAAPGAPAPGHGDLLLGRFRQREELSRRRIERADDRLADAVPGHVEEAAGAAGRLDLPRQDRKSTRLNSSP